MKASRSLFDIALASPLVLLFLLLCLSVLQGYQIGTENTEKRQKIAEARARGQASLSTTLMLDTKPSGLDEYFENQRAMLNFQIRDAMAEPENIEAEIERTLFFFHYPDFAQIEDRLGIELGREPLQYAEPPDEKTLTELSQMLLEFDPEERLLLVEVWSRFGTLVEYAPITDSRREVLISALIEADKAQERAVEDESLRLAGETAKERYFSSLKFYGPEFMLESMAPYLSPAEIDYFQVFQQMRYEATLITANRFDFPED